MAMTPGRKKSAPPSPIPLLKTTDLSKDHSDCKVTSTKTFKLIVKSKGPKQERGQMPAATGYGEGKQARGRMGGMGTRAGMRRWAILTLTTEAPQPKEGRHSVGQRNAKMISLLPSALNTLLPQSQDLSHKSHRGPKVSTAHRVGCAASGPRLRMRCLRASSAHALCVHRRTHLSHRLGSW